MFTGFFKNTMYKTLLLGPGGVCSSFIREAQLEIFLIKGYLAQFLANNVRKQTKEAQ